jgi:hypothetical protein
MAEAVKFPVTTHRARRLPHTARKELVMTHVPFPDDILDALNYSAPEEERAIGAEVTSGFRSKRQASG